MDFASDHPSGKVGDFVGDLVPFAVIFFRTSFGRGFDGDALFV